MTCFIFLLVTKMWTCNTRLKVEHTSVNLGGFFCLELVYEYREVNQNIIGFTAHKETQNLNHLSKSGKKICKFLMNVTENSNCVCRVFIKRTHCIKSEPSPEGT